MTDPAQNLGTLGRRLEWLSGGAGKKLAKGSPPWREASAIAWALEELLRLYGSDAPGCEKARNALAAFHAAEMP